MTVLRRRGLPRGLSVAARLPQAALRPRRASGSSCRTRSPTRCRRSSATCPKYVDDANATLADVQEFFDDNGIDVQIADQGETALETLGDRLSEGSGEIVSFTREVLTKLVEASIALILIIVLSVYLLLYGERIGAAVREHRCPRATARRRTTSRPALQRAVLGYVRGQTLFSLIMGTSAGVMLFVLGSLGIFPDGKTYALAFGAFFGFAELIPYVGPGDRRRAARCSPRCSARTRSTALYLVIAFTALQQLEGHVVAPNVFAQALRINPILVIFALLMGGQLYGLIGAFISLPIAAMLRETVVYFRRHLVLEPWPTAALAGVGTGIEVAGPRRCPECDAAVHSEDVVCTACGTELPDDEARVGGHLGRTRLALTP